MVGQLLSGEDRCVLSGEWMVVKESETCIHGWEESLGVEKLRSPPKHMEIHPFPYKEELGHESLLSTPILGYVNLPNYVFLF